MQGRGTGCGGLIAVAVIAFVIGRCSASPPESPAVAAAPANPFVEPDTPDVAAAEAADQAADRAGSAAADAAAAPAPPPPAAQDDPDGDVAVPTPDNASSGEGYTDVDGHQVSSPVYAPSAPPGASARCRDGSYSFSHHRSGTCSRHGGVAEWL